jgi:hypothetical protein
VAALTVRRIVARVIIAAAVTLGVITVVGTLEGTSAPRDITIILHVDAVPGVRAADLELRRGKQVVAHAERSYTGGLTGPLRLTAPALGADGEVRVLLDTEAGPLRIRRPLTAAGGSEVELHAGVPE